MYYWGYIKTFIHRNGKIYRRVGVLAFCYLSVRNEFMAGDIYLLRGDKPILVGGLLNFVILGSTTELIKKDRARKGVMVYLYFTGIDLAKPFEKPLLFEVSIYRGKCREKRALYSTLQEAEEGYEKFFLEAKNAVSN